MMRKLAIFAAGLLPVLFAAALLLPAAARADDAAEHATLDNLFAELKAAPDAAAASAIDQQIWHIWMAPADPGLAASMAAVLATEQSGDLPAALTLLDKLVADAPQYSEGWNQRATVEYELGNFDASLADIDHVLALEPRHFGALSGRVLVYLAKGNRPLAIRAMIAALDVDPFLAEKSLFPELSQPATQI